MKKKIAVICIMALIFSSFAQSVGAVSVIMNSKTVKFPDQEPVVENWTTLVPIRPIADELGMKITWDDPSDTVTLKKGNFFIEMVIGSTSVKTSLGTKTLAVAPKIINGRTMVPLRFIAEQLGLTVDWNEHYQRIIIVGEIDEEKFVAPVEEPTETATDVTEAEDATETEDATFTEDETGFVEEETEIIDTAQYVNIDTANSTLILVIPEVYTPEDIEDEESFSFKSLDAFDAQHTYNWEIVTMHESYVDDSGTSGILYIVQEMTPYEGEEYDISVMNQELPEAPIKPERPMFPELDWEVFQYELELALVTQIFTDLGVEMPEDVMDLEDEAVMELLGLSEEDFRAQMEISMENADLSAVPGYDEYLNWQIENEIYGEEMQLYREEVAAYNEEVMPIINARNYALRHFQSVYENASDEEWATLYSSVLNHDEEVRYENVEIVDFEGKKVVHATIYAEDPDDEQGTYEYYQFSDGDHSVTIFGGSLNEGEASGEVCDILSNMIIN